MLSPPPPSPASGGGKWRNVDKNAVVILAVLLGCTVLGVAVNSAVRWLRRRAWRPSGGIPALAFSSGMQIVGAGAPECAICLTEFAEGDRVRVLAPCNHGFHAKCVEGWLARQSSCPYCRGGLAAVGSGRDLRQASLVSGSGDP